MNEQIRGYGINMESILHAIPIIPRDPADPGQWHAVDFQRSGGVSIYSRETLITRIADLIGEGHIYMLDIRDWRGNIDRAGNVWLDHEYLSPHQYLPKLIAP